MKILVVEDNADVRKSLAHTFEMRGITVAQACDGIEAEIILATSKDVELVLTDYQMPRADGLYVLKAARRAFVPAVMMSGDAGTLRANIKLAFPFEEFDAVPILDKPFRFSELHAAAARVGVKL